MRASLVPLLVALSLACDATPGPPLDAASDRDTRDVYDATPDLADAPKPTDSPTSPDVRDAAVSLTCRPCLYDAQCGAGGRCVAFDPMALPGARMCLSACTERDAPCDAPVPARCREDDASGALLCTPTSSCAPMSSRRATACPAEGCTGRYAVCVDLDATPGVRGRTGRVCLPPCARDSDCEDGLRRCMTVRTPTGESRACVPDDRYGPDACGLGRGNALGVGRACDAMTACAAPLECLTTADPALRGFCTRTCDADAVCGAGARCLAVGTGARRCVPDDCACAAGARDALLDRALAQGDPAWSRCNLFFTQQNLDAFPPHVTRDRFRLPLFDRVHRDWLYGARFARDLGPSLDGAMTLSASLSAMAGVRADGVTTSVPVPALLPSPASGAERAALVETLVALSMHDGGTADRARIEAAVGPLPSPLHRALARVLAAALAAARERDEGLPFARETQERERLFTIGGAIFLPTNRAADRPNFAEPFDLGSLLGDVRAPVASALRLAATIEAIDWAPLRGAMGPTLDLDTDLGRVIVRDGAAHTHRGVTYDRTLLVLDLGGDDTYEAAVAANADVANSVSVLIDLGGADTYGYAVVAHALDTPEVLPSDRDGRARSGATGIPSVSRIGRQGAARLGVALHYDLGTDNDRYRSLRMSQGFAAYGVGGLYDGGGDDQYAVEAGGQGAAVAGVAALVDAAGNDTYTTWAYSQGFAYVQGAALLYDRDGRDVYDSKVRPAIYGGAQDPTVNGSFTQGAGFGRRGDATPDRTNMSGGIGVLRDRAGNDQYTTSIFGQGTGYWGGMGLLLDGSGDDRYDGRWYVQGGSAHFAYAALVDGGGRDAHNTTATRQNMTAGAGHDFSLGLLLAFGRDNDTYGVPNLALGAGNANGAGIFADEGGDDRYEAASALTLGNGALETLTDPGRLMRPTAGVFLDGDGVDVYVRPMTDPAGNNRTWTQRIHPEAPSERGFGADATGATLGL